MNTIDLTQCIEGIWRLGIVQVQIWEAIEARVVDEQFSAQMNHRLVCICIEAFDDSKVGSQRLWQTLRAAVERLGDIDSEIVDICNRHL